MNEQQLADLFSEQIDQMLQGDSPVSMPDVDDLQALLEIGQQLTQTQFQAGATAQSAFLSQLTGWFGPMNGGSSMTIFGLSKTWFISIVVAIMIILTGTGFVALIATSVIIFSSDNDSSAIATVEATGTAVAGNPYDDDDSEPTLTATTVVSPTATMTGTITVTSTGTVSATMTGTPAATSTETNSSATVQPSGTPDPPVARPPTIILKNTLVVGRLCKGAYVTQSTIVNYGFEPVTNGALVWEVIEGAEFVEKVNIESDSIVEVSSETEVDVSSSTAGEQTNSSVSIENSASMSVTDRFTATHGYANFSDISVDQDVDLDIAVGVNDDWWEQPDGTEIKVALSVENSVYIEQKIAAGHFYDDDDDDDEGDLDRGHGNDPDGFDEDNPGRSRRWYHDDDEHTYRPTQVLTFVKQGAKWVTLDGFAHAYGKQTYLVDGKVVVIDECTGLPPVIPPGSDVKIIGILQPDGTFIAIKITIINVTIINGDFDSGVPYPSSGGGGGGDDDDDGGGGGKRKGGDHDRGHGNDPDHHDEDNPGRGSKSDDD